MFAGVGGFRCGLNNVQLVDDKVLEDNTWDFVWANQWEPSTKSQHAFDCYTERFGKSVNHSNEDITKVNKKEIPNHTLLVGGFPCQDYSVAHGLSKEKGIEGKKGVLWWEIADILKVKHPPFVLLENVDRLLISPSKQKGRDFAIIEYLKKDFNVLTEHLGDKNLTSSGEIQMSDEDIYNRDCKWICEADFIVAEVSNPSLGVGYEIGYAEKLPKPILCLYKNNDKKISAMIKGNKNLFVHDYSNIEDVKLIINDFTKMIK